MKKFILIAVMVSLSVTISAREKGPKVICGPYVQCVTETGFTVTWVTDMDAVCWVETAPDDGTHFYGKSRTRHYDDRGFGIHPVGRIHKVKVDGMKPGEACRYRLMNKGVISFKGSGDIRYTRTTGTDVYRGKPFAVRTFREDYDTLKFDIYNDIHGRDSLLGVLMSDVRPDLDFVAFNGDMTSNIESHEMIQSMYLATAAGRLDGNTPLVASRGNHEFRGKDAVRWFDYFSTPTGQTYYSFRIGKFFFIVLDACEDKPDNDIEYSGIINSTDYLKRQEQWLKDVIASEEFKSSQIRIAFCHIPPETNGWHGNMTVCKYFVPHLNEGKIDAMFCGHIHRWRHDTPESDISDAVFDVICSPNAQRTEVTLTPEKLMLEVYNSDGTKTSSLNLEL